MLVTDDVDERQQDVESGAERAGELAESFHHVGALLRHDDRGARQRVHDERGEAENDDQASTHEILRIGKFIPRESTA